MRPNLSKTPLVLALFALGCGAIVVVGEGGGAADGEVAQCPSVEECCEQVCTFAASLPCFDEDDDSCECGEGSGDGCKRAWRAFMECALPDIEQAVQCQEDGPVLSCAVCPNKRERVAEKCDRELRCSDL